MYLEEVRRYQEIKKGKRTKEAMYVERNIEARSCSYFCSGKAISIAQPECICSPRYPARNAHAPYCYL